MKKIIAVFLSVVLSVGGVMPSGFSAEALPAPGSMVVPGKVFAPCLMMGVKIYPADPLRYDFIVNSGNTDLTEAALSEESVRLIKYFLAALTTPDADFWVNLSPYENNRIIPDKLGLTQMGRELLAQDYILKQLSASLLHPDGETGKKFWENVYARARAAAGTTEVEIPTDVLTKVWIVPDTAVIGVQGSAAYLKKAHLKVMTETDYLAMEIVRDQGTQEVPSQDVTTDILREVVIPEIERAVNEDEMFVPLRQVYHSLVLAVWLKEKIKKDSALADNVKAWLAAYLDQNKVSGVDHGEQDAVQGIWRQYVDSFQQGVFNFIREESTAGTGEPVLRKFFSGGVDVIHMAGKIRQEPLSPGDISSRSFIISAVLQNVGEATVTDFGDPDRSQVVKVEVPGAPTQEGGVDFDAQQLRIEQEVSGDQFPKYSFNKDVFTQKIVKGYTPRILTIRVMSRDDVFFK